MKTTWIKNGRMFIKAVKIFLPLLVSLGGIAYSSDADVNSDAIQVTAAYNRLNAKKILAAEKQRQDEFRTKQALVQAEIDSLQSGIPTKLADAKYAHEGASQLRVKFLDLKKIVPRDLWREIYGEKKYVMSSGAKFVRFSGQIQEVAPNGIRVFGEYGDSTKAEYFVINFPYDFKAGESVDPTKIYVALEDGKFSYVSEDGFAKTLPKLNYGKPCARPKDASAVELAAQKLTAQEESKVSAAEHAATEKDNVASAAKKRLQEAQNKIAAVRNEAADGMKLAKEEAIKYDLVFADKDNIDALRRMGERYRDGDGVERDANKASEYDSRAERNFKAEAARIDEAVRLQEQKDLKQKFLLNLELAERGNAQCALYVGRCYRYGLGTEKDMRKADEYESKAISLGLPKSPNRSLY